MKITKEGLSNRVKSYNFYVIKESGGYLLCESYDNTRKVHCTGTLSDIEKWVNGFEYALDKYETRRTTSE